MDPRADRAARLRLVLGAGLLLAIVVAAVAAPLLAPFPPDRQFDDGLTDDGMPLGPGGRFPLGTDLLGRDLLSRLLFGARVSLALGLCANALAVAIGAALGVLAGFAGGRIAAVAMRVTDLMMAFPALLLAIALASVFHPSLAIVALVIGIVNSVPVARVLFTETRSIVQRDFVRASIAIGAHPASVLARHVVPHLVPTLLVYATLGVGTTVLLEATLSFLGVGVRPPTPSWGNIMQENESWAATAPVLVLAPGAAIAALALASNLLGEGLRLRFDPASRDMRP